MLELWWVFHKKSNVPATLFFSNTFLHIFLLLFSFFFRKHSRDFYEPHKRKWSLLSTKPSHIGSFIKISSTLTSSPHWGILGRWTFCPERIWERGGLNVYGSVLRIPRFSHSWVFWKVPSCVIRVCFRLFKSTNSKLLGS